MTEKITRAAPRRKPAPPKSRLKGEPSKRKVAEARAMFDGGLHTQREIADFLGLKMVTYYNRRIAWRWGLRPKRAASAPGAADALRFKIADARQMLREQAPKIRAAFEQAAVSPVSAAEAEALARVSTAMVKTMNHLKSLEEGLHGEGAAGGQSDRTLDELRDELTRRIAAFDVEAAD